MERTMNPAEPLALEAIGTIRSCFTEKFGTPRQPGLCPSAWGELQLLSRYRNPDFLRGIEGFSHLWIVFGFHALDHRPRTATVRPPRLGGNERTGVFATRSNFRPNPIGLSVARLEEITHDPEKGPLLRLGGIDILDGSPVYDVKPYLPYADALPGASAGFAKEEIPRLAVECAAEAAEDFAKLPQRAQALIREALALDPRPAVRGGPPDRSFATRMADCNIRFTVDGTTCRIISIATG
jgi:tRNA-Thr(GGU) m(6)t(6)A37 methyltransferase TsaA